MGWMPMIISRCQAGVRGSAALKEEFGEEDYNRLEVSIISAQLDVDQQHLKKKKEEEEEDQGEMHSASCRTRGSAGGGLMYMCDARDGYSYCGRTSAHAWGETGMEEYSSSRGNGKDGAYDDEVPARGYYAVAWIDGERKVKTHVVRCGGKEHPTWNAKVQFAVREGMLAEESSAALTVQVLQRRRRRSDALLGTARVLLCSLARKGKGYQSAHSMALLIRSQSGGHPRGLLNIGAMLLHLLHDNSSPPPPLLLPLSPRFHVTTHDHVDGHRFRFRHHPLPATSFLVASNHHNHVHSDCHTSFSAASTAPTPCASSSPSSSDDKHSSVRFSLDCSSSVAPTAAISRGNSSGFYSIELSTAADDVDDPVYCSIIAPSRPAAAAAAVADPSSLVGLSCAAGVVQQDINLSDVQNKDEESCASRYNIYHDPAADMEAIYRRLKHNCKRDPADLDSEGGDHSASPHINCDAPQQRTPFIFDSIRSVALATPPPLLPQSRAVDVMTTPEQDLSCIEKFAKSRQDKLAPDSADADGLGPRAECGTTVAASATEDVKASQLIVPADRAATSNSKQWRLNNNMIGETTDLERSRAAADDGIINIDAAATAAAGAYYVVPSRCIRHGPMIDEKVHYNHISSCDLDVGLIAQRRQQGTGLGTTTNNYAQLAFRGAASADREHRFSVDDTRTTYHGSSTDVGARHYRSGRVSTRGDLELTDRLQNHDHHGIFMDMEDESIKGIAYNFNGNAVYGRRCPGCSHHWIDCATGAAGMRLGRRGGDMDAYGVCAAAGNEYPAARRYSCSCGAFVRVDNVEPSLFATDLVEEMKEIADVGRRGALKWRTSNSSCRLWWWRRKAGAAHAS